LICPIPSVNLTGNDTKTRLIKNIFIFEKKEIVKIFDSKYNEQISEAIENTVYKFDAMLIGNRETGRKNKNSVGGYTCGVNKTFPPWYGSIPEKTIFGT
jgi:hypothetical protein